MKKGCVTTKERSLFIFHSYPFKTLETNGIGYLIFTKAPDAHS